MGCRRVATLFASMSDFIGHECGLAMVRLRQPLSYYTSRYDDPAWGLRRLYLLMEKQHNRGQDGAGLATIKFDMPPGDEYFRRVRSPRRNALERLFDITNRDLRGLDWSAIGELSDVELKRRCEFLGETYLGHLRYGTHAGHSVAFCHPYVRHNNTASRHLAIAGNFNMTNSRELFNRLVDYGLNPVGDSDTQVILERLGYLLDKEHEHLASTMGPGSFRGLEGRPLAIEISNQLNLVRILEKAARDWDGGYVFGGLLGNGDTFMCRDPSGIRPGFYYIDDEVVAAASERAALAAVFNIEPDQIEPIQPGHVLIVKRNGHIEQARFAEPLPKRQCTFERIYFSRGNDPDIYEQRKELGRQLAPRVLEAIDFDLERAVFSYVPNTAEIAYTGMVEAAESICQQRRVDELWAAVQSGSATREDIVRAMRLRPRAEKIAHKDQRLRTFITHDAARRDLVMHIYDITRGIVGPDDTLIVVDDSIVRGTTLRESIITMLSRLNPARIIVVSSAPPIQYPDCYGIDMSQLGRFIAFEAAVALIIESGREALLQEVEDLCREQAHLPPERMTNYVARLYEPFSLDELSRKIAELVTPRDIPWKGQVDVLYQSVEGLRSSMPGYTGDWYFTGNYPTPGGYRVLNRSYLQWRDADDRRAY